MRSYEQSPLTESQADEADSRIPLTGQTLPDIEKQPATAEALLKVRSIRRAERWQEIARNYELATDEERRLIDHVWKTMPGYTCRNDAARLIARVSPKENHQ